MTTLESMIAVAGEAPLADSLDFSLPPASTSVVDRRQHVRAYPTSASTLTPTTTRTVRIRLGGDEFINPNSVRLQYTIVNNHATLPLNPTSGPWGMWGQVYERSGGVEISNIPNYGRFHQQFGWNHLSMEEQFGEAGLCGMGGSWGNGSQNNPELGVILGRASYTVMHRLHTTLLTTSKLLPTRYMPLEYELSLNSTVSDWLVTTGSFSSDFSVQNIQLIYDAYILDESVLESFYKSLLSNRVLSIPCIDRLPDSTEHPGRKHKLQLLRGAGLLATQPRMAHLQGHWPQVFPVLMPHRHRRCKLRFRSGAQRPGTDCPPQHWPEVLPRSRTGEHHPRALLHVPEGNSRCAEYQQGRLP